MTDRQRQVVILLNGVGSVGKSTLARELQNLSSLPLLHISMDGFLDMLPAKLWNDDAGIRLNPVTVNGKRVVHVHVGDVGKALLSGFRHSVAAMVHQGNSLIVDDVMFGNEIDEYRQLLRGYEVRYVGVFAPLEVIEAREVQRGDREVGLARAQYSLIARGAGYDLEVDTSQATPDEIAKAICDAFGLGTQGT